MRPDLEKKFIQLTRGASPITLTAFAEDNSEELSPAEIGAIAAFADGLARSEIMGHRERAVEVGVTKVLDVSRTVEEGKKTKAS